MRSWVGAEKDRRGKEFNQTVAARLKDLGWEVDPEVKITKLLGKGFERDYGDVDVLAWRTDTKRVLIIECKDVQFKKTYGEVAEQLGDFRGEMTDRGKPDLLLKHLNRVDLINQHVPQLKRYIGIGGDIQVESHLVFKNPVPMQFCLKKLRERVTVSLYSNLKDI